MAADGQVGRNILAVGFTNTGKVQGVSLGDGNTVEVYADGQAFLDRNVLYREFMSLGEPIVFTGLANGAIIVASEGFYGMSEISHGGTFLSNMPLLSLGLGVTDSFIFAFRHATRATDNNGFLFFVNGALASTVNVTFGDGTPIADQPPIDLQPLEFGFIHLDGDSEYRIQSTNTVMGCIATGFNSGDFTDNSTPISAGIADTRLVLPTSNDIITHPRSGNIDAPFAGTQVDWFDVEGDQGSFAVSPGSPVNIQTATGNAATDYLPAQFTRFKATGLVVANSGADGAGRNATPACPVSTMSHVVAQPIFITDAGNGDQSSVTIASPYVGNANVYEWDDALGELVLAYEVPLNRQGVTVTNPEDQNHPTAGQVSNEPDTGVQTLVGQLRPGVVIADVPIMVIVQSNGTGNITLRSQEGTTASALINDDDEMLMFGITPNDRRIERVTSFDDGLTYIREIGAGGSETWRLG